MKVVIAIDSFKGSMTSCEVSAAVERGIKKVFSDAEVIKVPIADGGEGTVETLVEGLGGKIIEKSVCGPLKNEVLANYGILNDKTAVIEMAAAAGLPLLETSERNPLKTTTFGVGELIKDAINKGCRDFIIGIGGSSTNDAGIGMLEALGYGFYDENMVKLDCVGESLSRIHFIDDSLKLKALDECRILVACDVNNPFYGPTGAAHVFAGQKGADDKAIEQLDQGLKNFADVINRHYNIDISTLSGAGAAGGLGGGLHTFLNGQLLPGIEIIFDKIDLEDKIKNSDVIITGEGKMDNQSVMGKVPNGVSKLGQKHRIPVIGLAGGVTDDAYKLHEQGITAIFSIMNYPMTVNEAMEKNNAIKLVEFNTIEIFRLIKTFNKK